jgi:Undecaprenyl-phosphate galactose phosphotransferase WbaP
MLLVLPINHLGLKSLLPGFGLKGAPAVMVGVNEDAARVLESLAKLAFPTVEVVAAFSGPAETATGLVGKLPVVGSVDELDGWAEKHGVNVAIVVQPQLAEPQLVDLIDLLSASFRRVLVIPNLRGISTAETDVRDIEGVLALEVRRNLLARRSKYAKSILDLCLGIVVGLAAVPISALIALALRFERQGSVFYGHERVGKRGRAFTAWKFRTMVKDADEVLKRAISSDPALKVEWEQNHKLRSDPRLTSVGRVLRRLSLDELPQLWNVLRLEMSLVGPRPIVREEIHKYGQAFDLYAQVRPGLTGLWQVSGRSNLTYEERVRLDAYYVRNWSVWLDLVILIRTAVAVLTGKGAY